VTQLTPSPCHLDLVEPLACDEGLRAIAAVHERAAVVAYLHRLVGESRSDASALEDAAHAIEEGRHV